MKVYLKRAAAIVLPVILTVGLAAIILFSAVPSCSGKFDFSATFYYVCYDSPTDSQSAASVSAVVHSYGGAGYIVESDGKYFVTISCYYNESDADGVCKALSNKGLSCVVLEAGRSKISLPLSARGKAEVYKGTLSTLRSISEVCYALANGMDEGRHNQTSAKSVLGEVKTGLESLLRANGTNCFFQELSKLIAECDDVSQGYVFSYDVRRLQIAVCDSIIHVRLY